MRKMGTKIIRILMVVSSPSISTTTGWPVGFWAAELTHAYKMFMEKGYDVTIASPKGGKVEVDSLSDPRDTSGYSKGDVISLQFLQDKKFNDLLEHTKKISDLAEDDFDAIVVVGGQGPMFTFRTETGLQNIFLEFYEKGKISAALCHGTSLLLYLKNDADKPIIKDRKMTGFTNEEEDFADRVVGKKVMPFRIEDEAKKLGADFKRANAFEAFAIRDGNLITGQQ
ncbi:MAG TPA: type 1 glutamine amidotransferase domain-containing protein, partial [Nitrososphaeraceae archaeon]|nr:type 1 glutamine amidotransferase domain-containing protein [Nitrososphaeraceae archaeon]